jgi:putative membrane protein
MRFLARLILNAIAIVCAAYVLPGLHVSGPLAALIAGVILGFVNAIVRPVLLLLTLPLTLVTLGLFIFVVNAICLALTAWVVPGFSVDGFWWALGGALVVSIVSWLLNGLFVEQKRSRGFSH